MLFLRHLPAEPLRDFVDYLWLLSDAPPHAQERILPSGTLELVVDLRHELFRIHDPERPDRSFRLSAAIVSGAYSKPFAFDTTQHACVMGVHFKPAGASVLLGAPAGLLADAHAELDALWGPPARRLRERLLDAASPQRRFRIVEQALLARLASARRARPPAVLAALRHFHRDDAQSSVRRVVRDVGLSHRRFIQLFTAEVGMTPKLYCRVRRFQRAVSLASTTRAPDFADLALACGYFDQSHLIRDFRQLSGLTPAQYRRQRSSAVKELHVPIGG